MTGRRSRLIRLEHGAFHTSEAAQAHGEAVVGRYLILAEQALSLGGSERGRTLFQSVLAELPCVDVQLHRGAMSEELGRFLVNLLATVERHGGEAVAHDLLRLAQAVER